MAPQTVSIAWPIMIVGVLVFGLACLAIAAHVIFRVLKNLEDNQNFLWKQVILTVVKSLCQDHPGAADRAVDNLTRQGLRGAEAQEFLKQMDRAKAESEARRIAEAAWGNGRKDPRRRRPKGNPVRVTSGFVPTEEVEDQETATVAAAESNDSQENDNGSRTDHQEP